jgi:hypothetical protein
MPMSRVVDMVHRVKPPKVSIEGDTRDHHYGSCNSCTTRYAMVYDYSSTQYGQRSLLIHTYILDFFPKITIFETPQPV